MHKIINYVILQSKHIFYKYRASGLNVSVSKNNSPAVRAVLSGMRRSLRKPRIGKSMLLNPYKIKAGVYGGLLRIQEEKI